MKTRKLGGDADWQDLAAAFHLKDGSGRYLVGRRDEVHRGEDGALYVKGPDGGLKDLRIRVGQAEGGA